MDPENAIPEITYTPELLDSPLVRQYEQYSVPHNWMSVDREIRVKVEQTRYGTEWEIGVRVYSKVDHWHALETMARSVIHKWVGRHGYLQTWSPVMIDAAAMILDTINTKQRQVMRRNVYYPHYARLNIMIENYYHLIN